MSALGRSDEAFRCYFTALNLNNGYAQTHYALGLEWLKRNNFDQAFSSLKRALQLKPTLEPARSALARARQGKAKETISQYREALRIDPDSPMALNNLAWALATCPDAASRNGNEAVQLAERACASTFFQRTIPVGTLAAAYAEASLFEKAVDTARKACVLASSLGQSNWLSRNQELLRRYERWEAYHEED